MAIDATSIVLTPASYEYGDRKFAGYIADGSNGRKAPGILVAHEGAGLVDHPKSRAQMLAALGYVAYAFDLFGGEAMPMEEARTVVQHLRADLPELRGRVSAALGVLKAQPSVNKRRLGAIGFCFGGTAVLELARSGADVAGVVGFHAGLTTSRPEDAHNIRGRVLVCMGADDPIITEDQRLAFAEEMTKGGADWQMHVYGGVGHSFTNRDIDAWKFPGFAYDETADRRSWTAMRAFFDEVFS
jgi:dienelactone hydrolase